MAGRGDVIARYGGRVSRDTAVYMAGMMAVFPFSIVQAIVLTRLLDPSDYGRLALLLMLGGLVTVVASLGTLTGTFRHVYRAVDAGEEDGAEGDVPEALINDEGAAALVAEKQRALGSGIWLLSLATVVLATPLLIAAPQIGPWLLDVDGAAGLIRWATLSGVAGVAFRVAHNILRLERRPTAFSVVAVLRPAVVVGLAAWLVLEGEGLAGVLVATTAGTALATAVAVRASWRSYGLGFSREDARRIVRLGAPYIPLHVALWNIHNADVFLLSRTAPASDVGLYRLASRLSSVPSYFSGAFMLAHSSLERSSLVQGTYGRLEGRDTIRTHLPTYYLAASLAIVVVLSIAADALVRVAAASYSDAAGLVPWVALSFVAYGAFTVIMRLAAVRRARLVRVLLLALGTAIFVALSVVLLPALDAYALPLAQIAGMGTATGILIWLAARRSKSPLALQWRRLGATLLSAAACLALGFELARETGGLGQWALALGALVAYPLLLVVTGAVPRREVAMIRPVVHAMLHPRERAHLPLLAALGALAEPDRAVLELVYRHRVTPGSLPDSVSRRDLAQRVARALQELAGTKPIDDARAADVGEYVLYRSGDSTAARDDIANRLRAAGVDAWDLHELEAADAALRRAPAAAWPD